MARLLEDDVFIQEQTGLGCSKEVISPVEARAMACLHSPSEIDIGLVNTVTVVPPKKPFSHVVTNSTAVQIDPGTDGDLLLNARFTLVLFHLLFNNGGCGGCLITFTLIFLLSATHSGGVLLNARFLVVQYVAVH